jgi:diguanylate cyclase (GGDEF)-like protein
VFGGDSSRGLGRIMASLRAIDWRRRDLRDGIVIFGLALALSAWAQFEDIPFRLFQFDMAHADRSVDDVLFVIIVMSFALIVFGWRRLRQLAGEIRARRADETTAQKLTRHDPLTGLANRRGLKEKLEQTLRKVETEDRRAAVLALALDGLQAINDVHGPRTGDQALVEFAERIAKDAKGALVARVGDDKFTIVLPNVASLDAPAALARRICALASEPFEIAGIETALGVGIGIAVAPEDGTDADELVRRADLALDRAKAEGRSSTRFFEPAMDAHIERHAAIESELRAAIAGDQIEVHYQPLVSLGGDRIIGFEALARWDNPTLGTVFPSVFIAVAEECGLIHRLGDQLLRTACRDATNWPADFTLSFNLSPLQLRDPMLGMRVLGILAETGFPPDRLELEITESAIVGDPLLAQQLIDELRKACVRIALDDFGTGYATLSQLLAFRFDKIKIDRSFINKLGAGAGSEAIVRAIIGLAKGLGLKITAEGIETAAQLADLKCNGCSEGQGYLFGKAMPASKIPALLGQAPHADAVA